MSDLPGTFYYVKVISIYTYERLSSHIVYKTQDLLHFYFLVFFLHINLRYVLKGFSSLVIVLLTCIQRNLSSVRKISSREPQIKYLQDFLFAVILFKGKVGEGQGLLHKYHEILRKENLWSLSFSKTTSVTDRWWRHQFTSERLGWFYSHSWITVFLGVFLLSKFSIFCQNTFGRFI